MKRTHSMRFKRLKKILKKFGLLWQALGKFKDDNGSFLSSEITFSPDQIKLIGPYAIQDCMLQGFSTC